MGLALDLKQTKKAKHKQETKQSMYILPWGSREISCFQMQLMLQVVKYPWWLEEVCERLRKTKQTINTVILYRAE